MWVYEKTLQYPVNLKCRDLRMAKVIMTQLGGPNGELAAALDIYNKDILCLLANQKDY